MRLLETDSLSNQNISSALLIGTYTADANRTVRPRVAIDQVAGGGDYVVYVTLQIGGAGSQYVVIPKTTAPAAGGEVAVAFAGIAIPLLTNDVLRCYIDGLAGDTTTPDTRVDWCEDNYLQPTSADRTLDVAATGEAGLDFDNVKAATAPTTLTNITVPTVSAATLANGAHGGAAATLTLQDPVAARVTRWLTDDAAGTPAALDAAFNVPANLKGILGTALTESVSGYLEAAFKKLFDVATPLTVADKALLSPQDVRDAMKLAASAGVPAHGSVDSDLAQMTRRVTRVYEDFRLYADGALGNGWTGNWTIASGQAINTGIAVAAAVSITDPGLEANYTAGLCDSLTKVGSPTLAQSGDVHGGAKAQQFTGIATTGGVRWANLGPGVAGAWYRLTGWGKRTAGADGQTRILALQTSGLSISLPITSAEWTQYVGTGNTFTTNTLSLYAAYQAAAALHDTIITDDFTLDQLTQTSLFETREIGAQWAAVEIHISNVTSQNDIGKALFADSLATPANYMIVRTRGSGIRVDTCVAGVWAQPLSVAITPVTSMTLRAERAGDQITIYQDGALIGTVTVPAGILANTKASLFSADSAGTIDRFVVEYEDPMTALTAYDPPTDTEMVARTLAAADYALEATLMAIKGGGWTTETLTDIRDQVALRLLTSGYTAPDNESISVAATQATEANTKAGVIQTIATEARLAELDAANLPSAADNAVTQAGAAATQAGLARTAADAAAAAAGALPNLTAIRGAITEDHGAGPYSAAGASGAYTVRVTCQDALANILTGVLVTVKDAADAALIDQGATADDGMATRASFSLDAATYTLHASLPGYTSVVQAQAVDGNETVTLTLARISPSVPLAAGLCTVFGFAYTAGVPAEGLVAYAELVDSDPTLSGRILAGLKTEDTTDASGYFELMLPQGKHYTITVESVGKVLSLEIPGQVSADLADEAWTRNA